MNVVHKEEKKNMLITPALKRQRQEDKKLKDSLGYILRLSQKQHFYKIQECSRWLTNFLAA